MITTLSKQLSTALSKLSRRQAKMFSEEKLFIFQSPTDIISEIDVENGRYEGQNRPY